MDAAATVTHMTIAFTATQTIPASPDAVWSVLTDWDRAPAWLGVERMRGEQPPRVGSELTFVARGAERTSTITELEPGRRITMTSTQGPVTAHYRYALAPDGTGTAATLEAEVLVGGALKLLAPTIRRSIAKEDGTQLERLAAVVRG